LPASDALRFSDADSKRGALRAPRRLATRNAPHPASYTLKTASFNRQRNAFVQTALTASPLSEGNIAEQRFLLARL
jgi:hypothetical protein